jgi:fumarylacetoacetase
MSTIQSSWIEVLPESDFPIQNIPFGIFSARFKTPRAGTVIGESVIDLLMLAEKGFLPVELKEYFSRPTLNDFIALGKEFTGNVRRRIQELFREDNPIIRDNAEFRDDIMHHINRVYYHMPVHVPNYTDFYSSIEHATNVGVMFRGKDNALMPNWKHLPVGYHGRASSIRVSGVDFPRPKGQMNPDDTQPVFGVTRQMDFELEMAFIVGKDTQLGTWVTTSEADDYIFGMLLFNDWSARDIQKWEYVPLGPFLGKNFFSSVSPWIVTMEALEPFRVQGPVQDPQVLPYLQYEGKRNYDINLEVHIIPANGEGKLVSKSNFKYMYWNMCQQLAHHTVNGCNICVGDLYASGTISGPDEGSYGSMLELTWKGTKPIQMPDGTERKFLLDNDTVLMRAYGIRDGVRIGFGELRNRVLPAVRI